MNAPQNEADAWEELQRERGAQGLPPTIEDPAAIRRLAHLIVLAADRIAERERRAK